MDMGWTQQLSRVPIDALLTDEQDLSVQILSTDQDIKQIDEEVMQEMVVIEVSDSEDADDSEDSQDIMIDPDLDQQETFGGDLLL
jgi:hypothetical protein